MTRPFSLLASLLALVLPLAACKDRQPPPAATFDDDPAAADVGPCALVTAEEAAAAIGPLAGPPYRARDLAPDASGDTCRFESRDFRSLIVHVEWSDGAMQMGLMSQVSGILKDGGAGELRLVDGTTLEGQWDEARIVGCCELHALRGEQLVTVDIAGTRATLREAGAIADAAIRRLDQPLAVDDPGAAKAALARHSARPRRRSVCELVSRAEAERLSGGALREEPVGDEEVCSYLVPLGTADSSLEVTLKVQWRDGFRTLQAIDSAMGRANSAIGIAETDERESGPWEEFSRSVGLVMGVRQDVLASVESGPFRQDLAQAFVAKALENLDK